MIYVFYAKIISELFFPSGLNPFWAMLNTYGIFAAGYFFRPLGGVVMAHFGDLIGRKRLFSLSILLMALPTLMTGGMPTFESIGYAAPLLLLLMPLKCRVQPSSCKCSVVLLQAYWQTAWVQAK